MDGQVSLKILDPSYRRNQKKKSGYYLIGGLTNVWSKFSIIRMYITVILHEADGLRGHTIQSLRYSDLSSRS